MRAHECARVNARGVRARTQTLEVETTLRRSRRSRNDITTLTARAQTTQIKCTAPHLRDHIGDDGDMEVVLQHLGLHQRREVRRELNLAAQRCAGHMPTPNQMESSHIDDSGLSDGIGQHWRQPSLTRNHATLTPIPNQTESIQIDASPNEMER